MDYFFQKEEFFNNHHYVEYANLNLITILAAVLYLSHGIVLALFAYSHFFAVTQALSVLVCLGAFFANRRFHTRAASIMMIALICASINIWPYSTNVGSEMRWYAVLAICPLYFFSTFNKADRFFWTGCVLLAFLTSSLINYYVEPLAIMPYAKLYNTVSSMVVLISIAVELILYKYINTMRNSELERIGTILANIECGIVIVDAKTREILDINPVAERLYGGDKGAVVGQLCHSFICPIEQGDCPVLDRDQEVNRSEELLLRADGETIPIIKTISKIWYQDRFALLESFTDVSALKEAEEKLRLLEITERSNRAKSEFLSRMSHEMRTPMNAIIGMAKIAEGTDDLSRLKYCLSSIGVSSAHLLDIINDILDMSKIEAGKFEIDSAPLYVEQILMKICNLIMEQTERKNLKLNIYMGAHTVAPYLGDELRLTQVIANITSNAVKFTPEGGEITMAVNAIEGDESYGVLRFSIADTGIGMTEEQLGGLFLAFEQVDGGITRQYGGTGLGLAISKHIVENMGGQIWAESEPDMGSTFLFEVRLERNWEEENPLGADLPPDVRILVVSTNEELRTYCTSVLGDYGLYAGGAESTEAMYAQIELAEGVGMSYDAVFLDYEWADADGVELLHRLMIGLDQSNVWLIVTPRTLDAIEAAARDAGFHNFILKPLFPSTLFGAIGKAIGAMSDGTMGEQNAKQTIPDFSGATLLLVEDIELNREIFIALMEDTNIEIDIAENGQEAVDKFRQHPDRYDAIVMDIQMPIMNGYKATELIRSLELERAGSIPIIAMTADAFKEDIELCLACGMNDHLKKPIELERVFEKLAFYCKPEELL